MSVNIRKVIQEYSKSCDNRNITPLNKYSDKSDNNYNIFIKYIGNRVLIIQLPDKVIFT